MSDPSQVAAESNQPPDDASSAGGGSALLIGTIAGAVLAASVAVGYGLSAGLFSLTALAVQMLLVGVYAGLALHANLIRKWEVQLETLAEQQPRREQPAPTLSNWGEPVIADDDGPTIPSLSAESLQYQKNLHRALLLIPVLLGVALAVPLLISSTLAERLPSPEQTTALAVVCLGAACIWLVVARVFDGVTAEAMPEGRAMALACRESYWSGIVVGLGILGTILWPPAQLWAGRVLLVWLLLVCLEQLVRLVVVWMGLTRRHPASGAPLRLFLREALFVEGNPLTSLLRIIEERFGVSFRSSWAIRFVARASVPLALLAGLIFWGLTSLAVVQLDSLGVRESFGRIHGKPLPPGLHLKWPWPLGSVRQYPVKKVTVMPVGFVLKDDGQPRRALLWSKTHAGEEFKLVLGDGSEVVVVDALVYYKICEDERRFRQYVYDNTNPDEALEAYAYRALMEQTRGATLNQILTLNREQFAGQLRTSLARYAEQEGLGIEVVEVALVALHPPEEVVPSFLDVIGAQIDATRMETEADGKRVVKLTESEQQRDTMIAEAEQFASQRVGEAIGQSSEFLALGEGYAVSPEAIRLRFWFETIEQTLSDRPLIILDKSLTTGPGETLFDLRKYQEIIPGGVR